MAAKKNVIRELLVRLGVVTDTTGIKAFRSSLEQTKTSMAGVAEFGKRVAQGVALATGALVAQTVATARSAEAIERQARALNLSTDAYQQYTATFERFGSDASDLSDAFNTIADRVQDASDGMQSYIDDLGLVGIEVQNLKGLNPEQLFLRFADAVQKTTDPVRRNAAVVRILGDDLGRRLLPMLMDGSAGIAAYREEMQSLGVVLGEEALGQASQLREALARLDIVVQGVRNTIGVAFTPTLERLVSRLSDFLVTNRELIRERLEDGVERFANAFGMVETALTSVNNFVQANLGGWVNLLRRAQAAVAVFAAARAWPIIVGVVQTIGAGLAAIGATTFGGAIAAVAGLAAAFGVLYLAVDDVVTYMEGGESVIGRFLEETRNGQELIQALSVAFEQMSIVIDGAVVPALGALAEAWLYTFKEVGGPTLRFFSDVVLGQVTASLNAMGQGLEVITTLFDALLGRGASFRDVMREGAQAFAAGLGALPGVGSVSAVLNTSLDRRDERRSDDAVAPAGGALTSTVVAPRGNAPVAGGAAATSSNMSIEGSTYIFNGVENPGEVQRILDRRDQELARQLQLSTGG